MSRKIQLIVEIENDRGSDSDSTLVDKKMDEVQTALSLCGLSGDIENAREYVDHENWEKRNPGPCPECGNEKMLVYRAETEIQEVKECDGDTHLEFVDKDLRSPTVLRIWCKECLTDLYEHPAEKLIRG
jgi:hypothetical protein